jgi:hypothetical protein
VSVKVRARLHPFKEEYTDFYREAAPLSRIFADLDSPLDISHARFLIGDEMVAETGRIPPDGSTVYINIVPEGTGSQTKDTGKGVFWGGLGAVLLGIAAMFIPVVGIALGSALIGTGVSMMAGGAVLYNMEIPTAPSIAARENGNQMDSIRGSKNQARRLGYIPVLFGRHLVTPDLAAPPYTEIDVSGQQWLTQLFCAGYNDMAIETGSLKIGDTALTELSETKNTAAILAGTDKKIKLEIIQDGTPSALYPRICVEQQYNAVLKHNDDDGVPSPLTYTTPDKTTRINVDLIFPQGLIAYDDQNNKKTASVTVSVRYKPDGDPDSAYAAFPGWNQNVSAQTADMFRRQTMADGLPPGKYTVQITRVTQDRTDNKIIDTVYTGSVRAFADDRPVREEAARSLTLIALKIRASALANGVIDNFNFVAQSNISDYTPSTGEWTNRLTKNPASMLLYALQGKINPVPVADADIDWEALRDFWTFCDTQGYTCNAVQGDRELFSVLCAKIAKTGRASMARVNSVFSVVIDRERPAPVQLFSPRNTVNYHQTIVKADIPDEIAVDFIDETSGWASNERSVYNTPDGLPAGTESTKQTSQIWGITDPDIIFKFTRYQYACARNRPIIHTLECDIEYMLCGKGDLIEYAGDTALTGIAYGKITGLIRDGAFITGIIADTVFPQEADQTYGIRCRNANGLVTLDVVNRETSENVLLFETPRAAGILEEGDLVIFGLTGKITRQLIVTELAPADNFRATLTCVDYSPEIFAVDDPSYVVPPFDNKITTAGSVTDSGVGFPADTKIEIIGEQIKIAVEGISSRPTFTQIVEGFAQAGATVTPVQLSLALAGGFRFIALSWARQPYLSNLKEYQLQVSEDAVDWYVPRFDGADWKGEPDGLFATAATMVIHPNIPPAGTAEAPEGRFLYYRVRQRTMLDEYSPWSEITGVQTKLADTGDYGVNSISANALKTAELFALFAHIGETLIVDPAHGISSEEAMWANGDTRAVLNSKQIAFQYFLNQVWQTMARFGLEGVEASQVFSPDKLFITNDDMAGRRAKGYDIGIPYLSDASRVAHCDDYSELSRQGNATWLLDQYGDNFFLITGNGSLEGEAEGIALVLKAAAPYATEARALFGNFRLQASMGTAPVYTVDFWMKYFWNEGQVVLSIGNDDELLRIEVVDDEPYLNDVPTDGVWLNDTPADGVWLNEIKEAHTRIARYYQGTWSYIPVTDENGNPGFSVGEWYHIGIVNTGSLLRLLINDKVFTFDSQPPVKAVQIEINPTAGQIDGENSLILVDEILVDTAAAEATETFRQHTGRRILWGKLDDAYPWVIFNVKDTAYFRTNIFQSQDFAAAVREILNAQGAS